MSGVEKAELELAHGRADEPELVHPLTGEAIDLVSAPDEHLARFLSDLKESEQTLREAKGIVSEEVLRRMDKETVYTIHAPGGWELSAPSRAPEETFDALALRNALLEFADRDVISQGAVDRAVETVVTYKVRKAGVKALRKLGGQVAAAIDALGFESERRRYVTVKRAT